MDVASIFEGLAAIAQMFLAGAACVGVYVAHRQLSVWRSEHILKRRAEVAEKLLSRAKSVRGAIAAVRTAMESVPKDAENRRDAVCDIKWERLRSYDAEFDDLRDLQILHQALVGEQTVQEAVEALFAARQEIYAALATLSGWSAGENPKAEHVQLERKLFCIISSMGDAYDELGPKIEKAIKVLEKELLPQVRMQQ